MTSFKRQFISGVIYSIGGKYIGLVIQLVITGILSRLLTPVEFGVVAIATVFITFFNLVSDIGIGAAIVQDKTLTDEEINSIFSLSMYAGIALGVIFFIAAGPIAVFYNTPILKPVSQLLSLSVMFASFNIVPNALLLRQKQFRFVAIRTLGTQIISGALGIAAALWGWNVFALVVYSISTFLLLFITNFIKQPIPLTFRVKISHINKIFIYSSYQFLFNFVNFFSRNLDKLLIGKYMYPNALGYYEKSYRLMMLPVENFTHVLSPVIHSIFSEFQNNKQKILENYFKIIKILATIGFPAGIYLHFTAGEFITLIFGDQWQAAIEPLEILAFSVGIQTVLSSTGAIFQAANSTRLLFISGLLSSVVMVLGISYGVFIAKTLTGVAGGLLVAFCLNFLQAFALLIGLLNGRFLQFVQLFRTPVILAVLVYITEYSYSIIVTSSNTVFQLVAKSIVALFVWLLGLFITGGYKPIMAIVQNLFKRNEV